MDMDTFRNKDRNKDRDTEKGNGHRKGTDGDYGDER
jgi:hypothetical protein